jgi:hypothetical protein
MRKVTFLLAVFAISADAADFRALEMGQSCATAPQWEIAHGSTQVPGNASAGAETLGFNVEAFNRAIFASYFCVKGKLFTGNYSFPIETWTRVVESYRMAYQTLQSTYGTPNLEDPPRSADANEPPNAVNTRRYLTTWRTARLSVVMSIMPNQPTEPSGWRVFVVIGGIPSGPDLTIGSSDRGGERLR